MTQYLHIDGSRGEGGGQILRTSLALSALTRTPIHIHDIRAGRKRPGLMRQHLTGVQAAARICGGAIDGDHLGSREIWFRPGSVQAGDYRFAVGTAGSACLVLQTVLPPLLAAGGPSRVVCEGGTHNSKAPPADFIERCFLPVLARMGADVQVKLERHGFYPAGGGRLVADIAPCARLAPVELVACGPVRRRRARAVVANLRADIADRELQTVRGKLDWHARECTAQVVTDAHGPGNVVMLEVERDGVRELATGFGEAGVRAERVAEQACRAMRAYLRADVPVGEHLADQLMLPMALAGGGRYRTLPLTLHAQTNIDVIRMFLDVDVSVTEAPGGVDVAFSRR